jgi:hypothetical protein
VSKYLEGNIFKLAASNNEQVVFALTDGLPNGCYVYKYFFNGEEKIQTAWSKFIFDDACEVLSVEFIDSTAYFTMKRPDGIFLEKMNVEVGFKDNYSNFATRLDRRMTESAIGLGRSYNSATNITTLTLPYTYTSGDTLAVITRDTVSGGNQGGKVLKTTQAGSNVIFVQGNHTATSFYIGVSYDMVYKFSTPLIRASSGQSRVAVTDGRMQVKSGNLTYSNSLFFKILVTPKYRNTYTYKFTGPRLGTGGALIGEEELVSGAFKFPVMARNTEVNVELHNDSPFPCALLSMDWESWYQTRNQRL